MRTSNTRRLLTALPLVVQMTALFGCASTPVPDSAALSRAAAAKAAALWRETPLHEDCKDCVSPTVKTLARPSFTPFVEVASALPSINIATASQASVVPVIAAATDKLTTDKAAFTPEKTIASTTAVFSFGTGSVKARAFQANKLEALVRTAKGNPRSMFIVTGFADATGSKTGNERLSVLRALHVKRLLIRQGVSAQRISVRSAPLEYAADNANSEQRAINRRATVQLSSAVN